MASLAALLLLTSAPAPAATPPAASPPAAPVSAVGIARARILRPVKVTRMGQRSIGDPAPLVTHSASRRDGARVVDCY
ncbi:MAG: hypothetical protein SFV20_02865 [Sphingopyxis sp.]|nr:hypothetical protein [Sphingopyxis sp.]